ncbi:MAG: HD domain-containing protein [Gammaproteobacteria bacterium]|nr:HD domain-containing protein [Gammaproteobacteria bacterium]
MLIDGDPIAISREDLVIGEPVPWPLFDQDQRLLAKEGTVITSERQVEALLMRGAMRYEVVDRSRPRRKKSVPPPNAPPPQPRVLRDYQELAEALMVSFEQLSLDPESLKQEILGIQSLAERLVTLVNKDRERALVALHLMHEYPYTVIHPVHIAIIAVLMERSLGGDSDKQISIASAALTQNLAMNDLQEELHTQLFPPDEEQRETIQNHPIKTVEMLQAAGVTDELWLKTVLQHHESEDGGGYPLGLQGENILTEARIIALADRYTAMAFERPFRETRGPRAVLQTFYNESQMNKRKLPLLFIQQMGVYPPGLFVRLQNGETGMVVKRVGPNGKPLVVSYLNPRGGAYEPPQLRDGGATPLYSIKGVCAVDPESFELDELWKVVDKRLVEEG